MSEVRSTDGVNTSTLNRLGQRMEADFHLRRAYGIEDIQQIVKAANEIDRLREREKYLLESHTGCGCEPSCKVCEERGFT